MHCLPLGFAQAIVSHTNTTCVKPTYPPRSLPYCKGWPLRPRTPTLRKKKKKQEKTDSRHCPYKSSLGSFVARFAKASPSASASALALASTSVLASRTAALASWHCIELERGLSGALVKLQLLTLGGVFSCAQLSRSKLIACAAAVAAVNALNAKPTQLRVEFNAPLRYAAEFSISCRGFWGFPDHPSSASFA